MSDPGLEMLLTIAQGVSCLTCDPVKSSRTPDWQLMIDVAGYSTNVDSQSMWV